MSNDKEQVLFVQFSERTILPKLSVASRFARSFDSKPFDFFRTTMVFEPKKSQLSSIMYKLN